jgi:beta-glucanase (GH16 family)
MRSRILLLVWAAMPIFALSLHATPPPGFHLAWSDEFDGPALNTNDWNIQTGPRNVAINTASAVSVTNGCLVLTTYTENGTNYTGFIDTKNKVLRQYGYYEASIQFSNAPGNWSAFWLQSPFNHRIVSLNNPTNGVEMDIFEHRNCDHTNADWTDGGDFALHWNGYQKGIHQESHYFNDHLGIRTGFHTYGLLWATNGYTFFVDDKSLWTDHTEMSTVAEYILLSSEVQTKSWAGNVPEGGYPGLADSGIKMYVDYVRYYEP